MKQQYELVVIGGGPAGMAAALSAAEKGIKDILIIERGKELGGILNQCIHNGFGLHHFKEELTGPEYAAKVAAELKDHPIKHILDTMVIDITADKTITALNVEQGLLTITTKAIVLAMGCRERTRGAINIPGSRPSGVYTAGMAQRLINMEGYMPGKKVVILGSGDIGLIMARRMTLEGAKVAAVLEILPFSNGLNRNIVQCLKDYNIPLKLSHTVTQIHGKERLEGVTISKVDEKLQPIAGTEEYLPCDTLLLSVGLIPENELSNLAGIELDPKTNGPVVTESRETSVPGVFACGNVLQVHDLVDFVSEEGSIAGLGAARYLQHQLIATTEFTTVNGEGIGYVVPQRICLANIDAAVKVYMRVKTVCADKIINVYHDGNLIAKKREPKFLPAEMVSFSIKKEQLTGEGELAFKVENYGKE